ncbi:MAG: LLM class flavin-dependent oxidoreductase [Acidimicrobiia bacterium]|nr:LLM class flavin-dependent oxidoreductase [Acidimicrobiia bacterium]
MDAPVPLSVLDLAPVGSGTTPTEALGRSAELAQYAEAVGFRRLWVAEHHNMPGIASSSPAVLLAHLGARTGTIRLGSGGVMLPNHPPLVVAEQFGLLASLHPGRIDLGIGRAPGTDPVTAAALRRDLGHELVEEFPRHLAELVAFLHGAFPEGHPYRAITAVPQATEPPEVWLLGSSDFSAHLAGRLGLPFSFAHHFSAVNTLPALAAYRSAFRSAPAGAQPQAMVAVSVICADDDERARWLAGPSLLSFARLRQGRPQPLPTPEEAAGHTFTPTEREIVRSWSRSMIVGAPATVRAQLAELLATTAADEVMVTTTVHGHVDRLRSFELVAGLWPDVVADAAATAAAVSG